MVEKLGVDTPGDTTKIKARAKEVFLEIDTDNNGQIDQAELTVAMSSMGVKLKSSEVVNMMKEADADGCAESNGTSSCCALLSQATVPHHLPTLRLVTCEL